MAADDTLLNAGSGGETIRSLGTAGGINYPVGVSAYPTTTSPAANVLQIVDLTHGLPIQPMTGATFAVTSATFATAANQATEIASLASIDGKITACNTGAVVISSGTVTFSNSTIAVTNAGTFAVQISSALPAGTNVIGHVIVDSGTITTVGAVTAITNALPAGTNLLGKVGIDQTTPGTTNAVQDIAGTAGGYSPYSFLSTAAVQADVLKASAGNLYKLNFTNIGATPVFVRLYNKATTPAGSDTPVYRFTVPGNTAGAGIIETFPAGLTFSTGIALRCTGAIADADATALSANTVIGSGAFK